MRLSCAGRIDATRRRLPPPARCRIMADAEGKQRLERRPYPDASRNEAVASSPSRGRRHRPSCFGRSRHRRTAVARVNDGCPGGTRVVHPDTPVSRPFVSSHDNPRVPPAPDHDGRNRMRAAAPERRGETRHQRGPVVRRGVEAAIQRVPHQSLETRAQQRSAGDLMIGETPGQRSSPGAR
jgi:hypothetical protein